MKSNFSGCSELQLRYAVKYSWLPDWLLDLVFPFPKDINNVGMAKAFYFLGQLRLAQRKGQDPLTVDVGYHLDLDPYAKLNKARRDALLQFHLGKTQDERTRAALDIELFDIAIDCMKKAYSNEH